MNKEQTIKEYINESKDLDIYDKEVVEYKNQISFIQQKSKDLTITSDEDMVIATDLLDAVKKVEDAIVERKETITRPLMTALAAARDLFKTLEVGQAEAKKTIKQKMLDYTIAKEEQIEKEKSRIEARVEKGTIKIDTAIKKMEEIGDVPKTIIGNNAKTTLKTITKIRIVDESIIPREYLVPDLKKITEAVLKQKLTINGVETYKEKSIVGFSR